MKTAIVYVSEHHGNTKKLVDAIASADQVDVIDAAQVGHAALDDYELIGGIAKGHPTRDEIDGAVRFYEAICRKLQG